jgi:hypothetical protein
VPFPPRTGRWRGSADEGRWRGSADEGRWRGSVTGFQLAARESAWRWMTVFAMSISVRARSISRFDRSFYDAAAAAGRICDRF